MKQRIEYIDALRGFTMILVVTYHVFYNCVPFDTKDFYFNSLCCEFRMPLFFFVSGFVFFKASTIWNWNTFYTFLKKKIPVQLITPAIFLFFWTLTLDIPFLKSLAAPAKCGYWFTFVLFYYFLIYIGIVRLAQLIRLPSKVSTILLICTGLLFYFGCLKVKFGDPHIPGVLSLVEWIYFIFFVMGTLVRKHFDQFQKLLDTSLFLPIITLIFILLNFYFHTYAFKGYSDDALLFICRIIGPIIVFAFFRKFETTFSKESRLGRSLQYIGRRTLDVYLLHYFLVPTQLDLSFLAEKSLPIIELIVTFGLGLIIVAMCLLISNIIRLSPWVSTTFFGTKKPVKAEQTQA